MVSSESRVLDILAAVIPPNSLPADAQRAYQTIPEHLAADFVRSIYPELKNNPAAVGVLVMLADRALASDAPLTAWIEQLVTASRWLEERRKRAKLADMIEYVSCAVEGSALQQGHSVEWYLSNYGFERSESLR
jgi:hypothetical protein